MATLAFTVEAKYEKLIALRDEITKLENQLKNLGTNASSQAVDKIQTQLSSTKAAYTQLASSAAVAGSKIQSGFEKKIHDASQEVFNLKEKIIEQKGVVHDIANDVHRLSEEYKKLTKNSAEADKKLGELNKNKKYLQQEKEKLFELTQQQSRASMEVSKLNSRYKELRQTMKGNEVDEESEKWEALVNKVRGAAIEGAGIMGIGLGIKEFASQVFNVRGEFQKLEASFKNLLQSEKRATELMAQLTKTAATTPFGLEEVASGAKQLIAYGTQAEKVNDTLIKLGDIAAGVNAPLSDLVYLYGTTMTQGRMYTQDLRQFMGRGIPLAEELAKQFGVAKDKVGGLVTAGKVGAKEFEQALLGLASSGGRYAGLMDAQSKTLAGQYSNLEDSVSMMFNEIGKSSEGAFNVALKGANALVENYKSVAEAIGVAVTAFGVYKASLMVATAAQKAHMMVMREAVVVRRTATAAGAQMTTAEAIETAQKNVLTGATARLTAALKANTIALLASPYVWATAALTGLAYVIYKVATSADAATIAQDNFNTAMEKTQKTIDDRKQKIGELVNVIKSAESTDLSKALAFDELGKVAPELTKVYDSVDKLSKADLSNFNKQVDELGNKEREQSLRKQADILKESIDGYNKWLESSDVEKPGRLQMLEKELKSLGIEREFGVSLKKYIEALGGQLSKINAELYKIEKAKKDLATPADVKIKVAKESFAEAQKELKLISDYGLALKREISGETITFPLDGSTPIKTTEDMAKEIQGKIDALKKEQNDNPIKFTADKQKALTEYEKLLSTFEEWKKEAQEKGVFDITLKIHTLQTSLQNVSEEQEEEMKKQGYYFDYPSGTWKKTATTEKKNKAYYTDLKKKKQEELDNLDDADLDGAVGKRLKEEIREIDKKLNKRNANSDTKAENEANKRKQQQRKYNELVKKQAKDNARAAKDAEFEARQEELNAQEDSREKSLKQIQLDFEKQEVAIQRGYEDLVEKKIAGAKALWEADPKNAEAIKKGATFDESTVDTTLTKEESNRIANQTAANEFKRSEALKALYKSDTEAMRDYLKQYGTQEQQRLAITQEYEEKIAKAQTLGEKMSLSAKMQQDLQQVDEAFKESTNWEVIFTNIEDYSSEYLKTIREKLKAELQNLKLDPADAKALTDKLDQVNKQLSKKGNEWKSFFGLSIPELEHFKELQDELTIAKTAETQAQEVYNKKLAEERDVRKQIADLTKAKEEDISVDNGTNLLGMLTDKDAKDKLAVLLGQLGIKVDATQQAARNVKTAQDTTKAKQNAVDGNADEVKKATTEEVMRRVNENLQSLSEFMEDLGLENTKAGKAISSFAESSNYATAAMDSLKNGDFVGVVKNLNQSLGALGDTLGALGIGGMGDSDKNLHSDIERLTASNEALANAINNLKDELADSSIADATAIYDTMTQYLKESSDNTAEMMLRSVEAYNGGFLGIRGKHSSGSKINDGMSSEEWQRISTLVGTSIRGASDFFSMTSDEMAKVATYAPDLYAKIKDLADEGYEDASIYMDKYTEYGKQLLELEDAYKEKLTSTTFDSVRDEFKSLMMDMNSDSEDFADNFEEMMKQAVFESLISEQYKAGLESWYNTFVEKMKGGELTANEQEELRSQYQELVSQALADRDALYETMGWETSSSQEASSRGYTSMSESTGEELNGRFTAAVEGIYKIDQTNLITNESVLSVKSTIEEMLASYKGFKDISVDIQDMIAKSYIELLRIGENTEAIVSPIRELNANLKEIKTNGLIVK